MPLDADVLAGLLRQRLSQTQAAQVPPGGVGSMNAAVEAPGQAAVPAAVTVPSAVAPAPAAEADDESKLEAIIKRLFPDVDWEAKAEEVLARRGMTRPTGPGEFKPGWGHALATLGPALGALFGGQPAMAAPAAAASLGGARSGWQELQDEYLKKQEAYTREAGAVTERLEARSERKAMALLPILAMSAAERARDKIDLAGLKIAQGDFSLRQQQLLIQQAQLGLQKDAQAFDIAHRNKVFEYERFKHLNPSAYEKAVLEINAKKAAWEKEHGLAQLALQKGQLNEAIRHNKAMENISRAKKGQGESAMDQLKVAAILDKISQGDNDGSIRLLFGAKADDLTDADKMVITQYTSVVGKDPKKIGYAPEQVEVLRQRANLVAKRLGMPEFSGVVPSGPNALQRLIQGWLGL